MAVLRAILQRLYPPVGRDTPAAERPKTLIFVPSQRGTREIAKAVAKMAEEGSICLDPAREEPVSEADKARLSEKTKHLDYCDPDQDQKLMKEHGVRRLPVVDDSNRVIGIISDRDVKSASPSKATSLEVHEIQYLLAEVKAKDIMTSNPICVKSNESISKVALIMLDKKIGGMPVVDDDNHLLGIITDQDVFRVLVTIGGARDPGIELTVETSQEPGSLARVFDIVRKNKGRIVSVMTAYLANGNRHVFIRLRPFEDESASASLKEALETQTNLLEWTICSGMAD